RAVDIITADRKRWVETMLKEEYGIALAGPVAGKAAAVTFAAGLMIGLIPLLPFLWGLLTGTRIGSAFLVSSVMTALAFFAVGAGKSRFVEIPWLLSGLETLAVGGGAAALAYFCGALLARIA